MHPERRIRVRDIPPQNVQPFVPVVEDVIVHTLEARARKSESLNVVTRLSPHEMRRDMGAVGDPRRDGLLAPQGSLPSHTARTVTAERRWPRASGKSRASGL